MAYTSFSGGGEERRLQIWTRSRDGSTPTLLFESSSIAKTDGRPGLVTRRTRVAFADAPGGGEPVWLVANADGTGHASEIDELRYLSWRGGWYFCECNGSGGSGAWERREGRRTFGQIASKREHARAARSPDPCEGTTTKEEGEI